MTSTESTDGHFTQALAAGSLIHIINKFNAVYSKHTTVTTQYNILQHLVINDTQANQVHPNKAKRSKLT